jgi:hypothetical protein|nr:MAG TPA: hypothetical protein [Caudoviricetes sp.]
MFISNKQKKEKLTILHILTTKELLCNIILLHLQHQKLRRR